GDVQLAAISTLGRIGYKEASEAITTFLDLPNPQCRLFAAHALADLGLPVNKEFLLLALRDKDNFVRQEAADALFAVEGQEITQELERVAKNDFNEAVRETAAQALLRRELKERSPSEKAAILQR